MITTSVPAPPLVVSASRVVASAPQSVWNSILGEGLPGRLLSSDASRSMTFAHDGTKGWLPFKRVEGTYRLEPAGEGTLLTFSLAAWPSSAVQGDLLARRLQGYVEGALSARAASLAAAARRAA